MKNTLENRLLAVVDSLFRPLINKHYDDGKNIFNLTKKDMDYAQLLFWEQYTDDKDSFKIIAHYPFNSIDITECSEERLLSLLSVSNKRLNSVDIIVNGDLLALTFRHYFSFYNEAVVNLIKGE